jgi:hypothetical protein
MDAIYEVDWSSLEHAGGRASNVPQLLTQLESSTADDRNNAYEELNVLTDGGCRAVYDSSLAGLPFLTLKHTLKARRRYIRRFVLRLSV